MTTTKVTTTGVTAVEAIDAAFAGGSCEAIFGDGAAVRLPVHRWGAPADEDDDHLFVRRCEGATLDVGCGPGRLVEALADRGVSALGIDVSTEAIRRAHHRGAAAMRRDVFSEVPGSGTWSHLLLADGNLGIGGDPVRLLRRAAHLVHPLGTILAEIEDGAIGMVSHQVRLRIGEVLSAPFGWARVGADAIEGVAAESGLLVRALWRTNGRTVAELVRAGSA